MRQQKQYMRDKIVFISRHYPSYGQIETIKAMGYAGLRQKRITIPDKYDSAKKVVDNLNLSLKIVALVAPTWVHCLFWRKGYKTIEFVKASRIRDNKLLYDYFICQGLWLFEVKGGDLGMTFVKCPASIKEQIARVIGRRCQIQELLEPMRPEVVDTEAQ